MKTVLAEIVNDFLARQLGLIVRRDKYEEPCSRFWPLLLYREHIYSFYDYMLEVYESAWKKEKIWFNLQYFRQFSVDYFAFVDSTDGKEKEGELPVVAVADETPKKEKSGLLKFLRETFRREKPPPEFLPVRVGKDYYEVRPKECPEIVLCNMIHTKFGDEFPLGEDPEKRHDLFSELRHLEMAALMCIRIYRIKPVKLTCMLCFRKQRYITPRVVKKLLAWMIDPTGECRKLFPVLHKLARNDRFLFISASVTAKPEKCEEEEKAPIETANQEIEAIPA